MPRRTGDTRSQILQVATELFTEQGYEATSLREIAERLGVTKAALYYHFKSKDDLLVAILEPVEGVLLELMDRLDAADSIAAWGEAVDWVIDTMLELTDFFSLITVNRVAVETVLEDSAFGDHQQMHERVDRAVLAASDDLGERVRMVAALGAVASFDDFAPSLMAATSPEDLQAELRAVVRDILRLDRGSGSVG